MANHMDPATFYADHPGPNYWLTVPWFGFTREVPGSSKFILHCDDDTIKTFTSTSTAYRPIQGDLPYYTSCTYQSCAASETDCGPSSHPFYVPEPSACLLLMAGLVGLAVISLWWRCKAHLRLALIGRWRRG